MLYFVRFAIVIFLAGLVGYLLGLAFGPWGIPLSFVAGGVIGYIGICPLERS
jgi:hypothetical protein